MPNPMRIRNESLDRASSIPDRKSTRLNSSHPSTSYAVFCLKKKKTISYPYSCMTFAAEKLGRNQPSDNLTLAFDSDARKMPRTVVMQSDPFPAPHASANSP